MMTGKTDHDDTASFADEFGLLKGRRRAPRWIAALALLVVVAAVATFLVTRSGSSRPAAAAGPTASAGSAADPLGSADASMAVPQPPAASDAGIVLPTTPPPPPQKITKCYQADSTLESAYKTWHSAMTAFDATFASRASATSLLTSDAGDTATLDTTLSGLATEPGAVDAKLLESALIPLEDDLPLNQPDGVVPPSYPGHFVAVAEAAKPFAAC